MLYHIKTFVIQANQSFVMILFFLLPLLIGLIPLQVLATNNNPAGGDSAACCSAQNSSPQGGYSIYFGANSVPRTLTAQAEYPDLSENIIGDTEKPKEKKQAIEPITRKIPIWGEKIRAMGYDLPLPFGAGANFVWMDQGIDIRELTVGVGSASTEPGFIGFSNARSRNTATTVRLDAWLLPFMNIYGLLGYLDGNTELDINVPGLTVDVPIIGPVPIFDPFTIPVDVDYDGVTYGGGITLAGGYRRLFGSLDMNYTRSDINLTDGEVTTLTISPRLGILFESLAVKGTGALWVGAMYMDYKETISDSINLRQIDPELPSLTIDYEVKIKNKEKLNFIFGGQWEITKRWQLMAEGGVGERKQVILGAFFRF
jgi:hypothetical protein